MKDVITETELEMDQAIETYEKRLLNIRAGRANPSILDGVMVSYYGVDTPLKQLATISIPEARQLMIKPFDRSCLQAIEKGIFEANIGLMQAVKKFDLDKNVRLATYAMWWIKAAINDFILRSWSMMISILIGNPTMSPSQSKRTGSWNSVVSCPLLFIIDLVVSTSVWGFAFFQKPIPAMMSKITTSDKYNHKRSILSGGRECGRFSV